MFVRERVRKSEEVLPMKHSFLSHTQEEDQKGQGIDGCDFTSVHHFPFRFACSSANFFNPKTISFSLFLIIESFPIKKMEMKINVILRQFIIFPFPLPLFSANFFNPKTISLSF